MNQIGTLSSEQGVQYLFWKKDGELSESPLAVCLACGKEEAENCLETLAACGCEGALAVVIVPQAAPEQQEKALADLVFQWKNQPDICSTRISLTGSASCADLVWRLASHFPAWFSAVLALGGHADPYEVRSLISTPVRACHLPGGQPADSGVPADAERLAASLRIAGSDCISYIQSPAAPTGQEAWKQIFADGSALAWMLAQDKKQQFTVTFLKPGVWCIEDYFTSCCYLVEGRERALLIDTGMGEGDLCGLIRSLTPLPVDLAVTHPHMDHMRFADRFSRVYLHHKDIEALSVNPNVFPSAWTPGSVNRPELVGIGEGDRIDLGGVELEVQELGGHTENSVVFADPAHRILFTGDAVGSGYIALMICKQEELLPCISHYADGLQTYAERHLSEVWDYAWLGGHKIQENGCDDRHQQDFLSGCSAYFNPIRPQVLLDMLALCGQILDGSITLTDLLATEEHYCSYGTAGMFFRFL